MLTVKFTWLKSCPKLSDHGDADIIRYSEDMNDDVFCILSADLNMHTSKKILIFVLFLKVLEHVQERNKGSLNSDAVSTHVFFFFK